MKRTINFLQEFSLPLILGVIGALLWANMDDHSYHEFLHHPLVPFKLLGHELNFHFIINDIFMVLFFGIAGVEITQAALPGGALNPMSKAINPLIGTIGGVVGPVGAFFIFCNVFPIENLYTDEINRATVLNGWGIPTATDIALAWLVARMVFGAKHPAVSYLLLLAVADDAIGLGIIAIFYPDPAHPVEPIYLGLTLLGMVIAFAMRKKKVMNFWPYIIVAGGLSWLGLIMAHLHPALALVFIVPFLPADTKHVHGELFEDEPNVHSPLVDFEHAFKLPVDFGLFGFGLANAGVLFAGINSVTWVILFSLLIGKTVGIGVLGYAAHLAGSKLPEGMDLRSLILAGLIAGLGLTVALFVSGEAYTDMSLQGAAKMGALFSAAAAPIAIFLGITFRIKKIN